MNLKKAIDDKYMTVTDYANKSGKSRQTIHNMINDGRLGHVDIAGRKFIKIN